MKILLSMGLIAFFSLTNLFAQQNATKNCHRIDATGDSFYYGPKKTAKIQFLNGKVILSFPPKFINFQLKSAGNEVYTLSMGKAQLGVDLNVTYDNKHGSLGMLFKGNDIDLPAVDTFLTYSCE